MSVVVRGPKLIYDKFSFRTTRLKLSANEKRKEKKTFLWMVPAHLPPPLFLSAPVTFAIAAELEFLLEPVFRYSRERGLLVLSKEAAKRHGVVVEKALLTARSECFGRGCVRYSRLAMTLVPAFSPVSSSSSWDTRQFFSRNFRIISRRVRVLPFRHAGSDLQRRVYSERSVTRHGSGCLPRLRHS